MKAGIPISVSLTLCSFLFSCNTLKNSKYSAFNKFTYAMQQPKFHFKNDSLGIEGSWNWATESRAIPKASFLPKIPKQILRTLTRDHGSVLFATWVPIRKKYENSHYVPVEKKDVRYTDKFNIPFYIAVLVKELPFNVDTVKYKAKGHDRDYEFSIFASEPRPANHNFWIMEVLAAGEKQCYDFVCILDSSLIAKSELQKDQEGLFVEDIKELVSTR